MKNTKPNKSQENVFIVTPCKDDSSCFKFSIKHRNVKLIIYTYIITGTEANKVLQQQSLAISSEDKAEQRVVLQPTHFELGKFDKNQKDSISPDDLLLAMGMMLVFSYSYWREWLKHHNNIKEVYFLPLAALKNLYADMTENAEIKTMMQGIGTTISESLVDTWNNFKDNEAVVNEFNELHLPKHFFSPADNSYAKR